LYGIVLLSWQLDCRRCVFLFLFLFLTEVWYVFRARSFWFHFYFYSWVGSTDLPIEKNRSVITRMIQKEWHVKRDRIISSYNSTILVTHRHPTIIFLFRKNPNPRVSTFNLFRLWRAPASSLSQAKNKNGTELSQTT
jgi:hypothetical protein